MSARASQMEKSARPDVAQPQADRGSFSDGLVEKAKAFVGLKSNEMGPQLGGTSEILPSGLGTKTREAERGFFRICREHIRERNPEMTEEQVEERLRQELEQEDPEYKVIYPREEGPLPGYKERNGL